MPDTILQLIQSQAACNPTGVALLGSGVDPLSYRGLLDQIERTARSLSGAGITPADRVAVVLPGGPEMAACFLAVSAAATCAPLNPSYRDEEFDFYLGDLGAGAVILPRGFESPARGVAERRGIPILDLVPDGLVAGRFRLETGREPASGGHVPVPGSVALVLHTSGTTSRPKLVPLTQANLTASARQIQRSLALSPADRGLNVMPLFHIHGLIGAVLSSIAAGGSIACPVSFQAPKFLDWLEEFQPTWYTAVPTMHQSVLQRAKDRPDAVRRHPLRFIRSSSAALPPSVMTELEETFQAPVIESYGMTEASHQMASNPLPPSARKPGSVGIAAGPEVAIMDAEGRLLPAGETGEVVIRGASVTAGYENNPEANKAAFHDGWFRTGDQGYLDGERYLFLTGRLKEIINRGGEKIAPREIDEVLLEHPAVAQAVTFAIPDARLGEEIGVAVVLREGASADDTEVKDFVARRLADFKVPRRVVFLEEVPKGPTGKLQRIGLAERLGVTAAGEASETPYEAPQTETERRLCDLWCEVLGVARIGVRDDFFRLGGDSLLAGQLLARLKSDSEEAPSLVRFFVEPTVRALAQWQERLRAGGGTAEGPIGRRPPSETPVASSAQQQIWALGQLGPGPVRWNRPALYRLRGPVDADALRRSLTAIVARHEILRTTYRETADGIAPVVGSPRPVDLPVTDLAGSPAASDDEYPASFVRNEARRAFDLSRDPMLRARLLRSGDDDHQLFLNLHHIASDGWSSRMLLRELAELYAAYASGEEPSLPELPIQYGDFALWQRRQVEGPAIERQLAYWKNLLENAPEPLDLPADRPRPKTRSYEAGHESITLPRELAGLLGDLCRQAGATLFTLLLAALETLLHRYTGRDDIVVGAITANRTRTEVEPLIGLFMNMLAMRGDLSGNPTFREFLERARTRTLEAFANQEVHFSEVVRALNPERSANRTLLFDVLFQLRRLPPAPAAIGDVTIDESDIDHGLADYDLTLEARETRDGIECLAIYSSDLFEAPTIRRLLGHYRTLLESVAARPGDRLSELSLLTEGERRTMLVDWNGTGKSWPDADVVEMIERQAERLPDHPAVISETEQLPYRDLNARANRLAHRLRRLGVGPDVFVGMHCDRSPELLVGMLGILKAGGAYLPLDPEYPKERLAWMLEDASPLLVLSKSSLRDLLPPAGGDVLLLDESPDPAIDDGNPEPTAGPDDSAYIIYTSGSTGRPKGVVIPRSAFHNFVRSFLSAISLSEADRYVQLSSPSFDMSVGEIFPALAAGACLVLPKPGGQRDPAYLVSALERFQVSAMYVVPSLLGLLVDQPEFERCRALRQVLAGGEAVPRRLCDRFFRLSGAELYNAYGPTEVTVTVTYHRVQRASEETRVPIGRPCENTRIHILDEHRQPVPVGIPGEIYIGGASLAKGYWNAPELTAEKFVSDPFLAGERLYRTGDRARYLPDGSLDFLGRADHQVQIRGFRVELGEVEWALRQHPLVVDAAAVAREDARGEHSLVAYYVSRDSGLNSEALRDAIRQKLPRHMVPSWFVRLREFPRTASGKVDRQSLPEPASVSPSGTDQALPPVDSRQAAVSRVFAAMLGHSAIPPEADFFTIGGTR